MVTSSRYRFLGWPQVDRESAPESGPLSSLRKSSAPIDDSSACRLATMIFDLRHAGVQAMMDYVNRAQIINLTKSLEPGVMVVVEGKYSIAAAAA
jgi:hypothetical protein